MLVQTEEGLLANRNGINSTMSPRRHSAAKTAVRANYQSGSSQESGICKKITEISIGTAMFLITLRRTHFCQAPSCLARLLSTSELSITHNHFFGRKWKGIRKRKGKPQIDRLCAPIY